ncbi:MAG: outer membrane beta-barrel protein [Pseudomonadota bacterium]
MARRAYLGSTAFRHIGTYGVGALGVFCVIQGLGGSADADSLFVRDRNVSVLERHRPEFAAEGVRAGQFIVRPRLDIGVGYTSNAFAISNIPSEEGFDGFEDESDVYVLIRPSVSAETTWSRHALAGGAYGEFYRNARFDTETIANAGVFLNGQLDITRQAALFGGASYDLLHETRTVNNSAILFEEPVVYDVGKAHIGFQQESGRARYKARFDLATYDYDDVDLITDEIADFTPSADQDFRDRTSYSVLGQVGFAVTQDASIFFRGIYNAQEYDLAADEFGRTRDSDGWTIAAGAEFDLTRLVRGSVAVGYFEQDYDDLAFADLDGISVDGSLEWFPRERTTVSLTAAREASESAYIAAGGYVSTDVILRVDQEIRHNLIGYGLVGYGQEDFEETGSNQTIDRWGAGVGATYYLNRNVSTSLTYTYETQDIEIDLFNGGFDTDYDIHGLLWTVTLER